MSIQIQFNNQQHALTLLKDRIKVIVPGESDKWVSLRLFGPIERLTEYAVKLKKLPEFIAISQMAHDSQDNLYIRSWAYNKIIEKMTAPTPPDEAA